MCNSTIALKSAWALEYNWSNSNGWVTHFTQPGYKMSENLFHSKVYLVLNIVHENSSRMITGSHDDYWHSWWLLAVMMITGSHDDYWQSWWLLAVMMTTGIHDDYWQSWWLLAVRQSWWLLAVMMITGSHDDYWQSWWLLALHRSPWLCHLV